MNNKVIVAVALFAGLAGGMLTRYIAPPAALAQNQAAVTKEVRAQSFTLVDSADHPIGTFMGGRLPGPTPIYGIVLLDPSGHIMWSAGGSQIHQLSLK